MSCVDYCASAAQPLLQRYRGRLTLALLQRDRRAAREARQNLLQLVQCQLLHCGAGSQLGCQLPLRNSCSPSSVAAKPARNAGSASCGLQRPHMNTSTAA